MKVYSASKERIKLTQLFKNKNLKKTLVVTIILCMVISVIIFIVQTYGQSKVGTGCSYLDPPTIDILAFIAAVFLIIEGFWRILEHPSALLKKQATRIIRIMLGCSIVTIHVLQFMHK